MVYSMLNYQNPESPKYLIIVRAVILSIYLAKFLACIPLFIDDIIRIFRWLYAILFPANDTSNGNTSISRLNFLKKKPKFYHWIICVWNYVLGYYLWKI